MSNIKETRLALPHIRNDKTYILKHASVSLGGQTYTWKGTSEQLHSETALFLPHLLPVIPFLASQLLREPKFL